MWTKITKNKKNFMLNHLTFIHTHSKIHSINQNFMLNQLALHTYNSIHSINQNFMLNQQALHTYIKLGRSSGGVYFWKISGGCLIFEFYFIFMWKFQKNSKFQWFSGGTRPQHQSSGGLSPLNLLYDIETCRYGPL